MPRAMLFIAALAAGAPAMAAPAGVESGLEAIARPVEDARLADQRGKFITPAGIGYFGVEMQTAWQGPDGVTTNATLLFSVNFENGAGTAGASPRLLVGFDRSSGDPSLDVPGNDGVVVQAGLGSVQGAVQSQQIAGDDNRVVNGMRIIIAPTGQVQGDVAGNGLSPATGSSEAAFANGDRISIVATDNRLGLQLTNANGDVVRQGVDGAIGQAGQNVVLNSSGNDVRNSMTIGIGYDPQAASRALSVSTTGALRGIGL